jgi:hypothetical protein
MRLPHWRSPQEGFSVLAPSSRVELMRDGSLIWNGERVSEVRLAQYSHQSSKLNPRPFIIFQVENGAACSRVRVIRNLIDQQAKCQEQGYAGLCGEGPDSWTRQGDVVFSD